MAEGIWRKNIDEEMPELRYGFVCSVCGQRQTYGIVPFCMYCGSKMDASKAYGNEFKVWGEEADGE